MNIIELSNVNKYYIRSQNPVKRFSAAVRGASAAPEPLRFHALKNLSFEASRGECVGIIGKNGSGKSTLLRILAGITAPDGGERLLRGSVSAMLEPGAEFNPEYSGMRNIYLSAALGGIEKGKIQAAAEEIMEFAEIPAEFRNMPVKTYSAGMLMRLGFAVMLRADSDIILVDEALGVGDIRFQAKCFRKFVSLKESGRTILFVSHDPDAVRRFCTRAVWLDSGEIRADGDVAKVTSAYMEFCVQSESAEDENGFINRYGTLPGSIREVRCGKVCRVGEKCCIEVSFSASDEVDFNNAGIAVSIKDRYGLDLCVFRTAEKPRHGGNTAVFEFENRLAPGEYAVAAGFENRGTVPISYYEYIEGAAKLRSVSDEEIFGLVSLPCETEIR